MLLSDLLNNIPNMFQELVGDLPVSAQTVHKICEHTNLEKATPQLLKQGRYDPDISGITSDSRLVKAGCAFIALSGTKADGSQFIASAVKAGARAVISAPGVSVPDNVNVVHITTANPRLLLSQMAARFYTPQPRTVVAVTGTNGKTSVAHFCRTLWQQLGMKSASIGTIGVIDQDDSFAKENDVSLTTPDPVTLHRLLSELAAKNIQHVAIEASSHGLDQYRLDGVEIQAAAFTNLSRDHLDYHHSYENYLEAKAHLFDRVMQPEGVAVLNADIPEYVMLEALSKQRGQRVISYGRQGKDIRLISAVPLVTGQQLTFAFAGKEYQVTVDLVGEFQLFNLLTALGLVTACGAEKEAAVAALATLPPVPGRMEKVPTGSVDKGIFVDYSHTPDSLEKALLALRPHTEGRLIVVFGCGGDRDRGKRPQMGAIAANLADIAIVTDDNPRTEDAATIRQEALAACPEGKEIGNREEAIAFAIHSMRKGDIVLIAGKGHEKTQIMHDRTIPFDDVETASRIAREYGI